MRCASICSSSKTAPALLNPRTRTFSSESIMMATTRTGSATQSLEPACPAHRLNRMVCSLTSARMATAAAGLPTTLPPGDSGTAQGGDPANQVTISGFTSPTWVEVEVSQTATPIGNHISYKINNTEIIGYFNTNSAMQASTFSSGTVMVGYCDPWDDLANGSPGSGEGCAIIDNLRVVQLPAPAAPSIISASAANGNFLLSYTSEAGAYYVVQFKTNLTDAAWIPVATNSGTGGTITVTNTAASTTGFYRVQVQ